jgi:hypothetical protein
MTPRFGMLALSICFTATSMETNHPGDLDEDTQTKPTHTEMII